MILVGVGAIASAINAVAGGGSLLSFTTLSMGLGLPDRIANATNSVALWPGSFSGGLGFLNLLRTVKPLIVRLLPGTVIGSLSGAFLLLATPDAVFRRVVPLLILFAACLLLLQPRIKRWVGHPETLPMWLAPLLQFFVAVYGGYFGAGMGIMMLGVYAVTLPGNTHEYNAIKNCLGVAINVVCSGFFLTKGLVSPAPAAALMVGSFIGGYTGARLSQRVDPDRLRQVIAWCGFGLALWYAFGR